MRISWSIFIQYPNRTFMCPDHFDVEQSLNTWYRISILIMNLFRSSSSESNCLRISFYFREKMSIFVYRKWIMIWKSFMVGTIFKNIFKKWMILDHTFERYWNLCERSLHITFSHLTWNTTFSELNCVRNTSKWSFGQWQNNDSKYY